MDSARVTGILFTVQICEEFRATVLLIHVMPVAKLSVVISEKTRQQKWTHKLFIRYLIARLNELHEVQKTVSVNKFDWEII